MKTKVLICALFLISATAANASPGYFSQINAVNLPYYALGNGTIIAILDSGVDIDHPDLKDQIWTNPGEGLIPDGIDNDNNGYIDDIRGWDFTLPASDPRVSDPRPKIDRQFNDGEFSHGTAGAGFAAGRDDYFFGASGLATQAKIMPLRVLYGKGEGNIDDVVAGIRYAVNNGANVINLSFVGTKDLAPLKDAVRYAYDNNVVVVAAAGNGLASSTAGMDMNITPGYPACYSDIDGNDYLLTVASVGSTGKLSDFSNYGSNCISLAAPGEEMVGLAYKSSTMGEIGFGFAIWSGTSFSAPLVSAAAAIIKSIRRDLSPARIIEIIKSTASSLAGANPAISSAQLGAGQLDVKAAVAKTLALQPSRLVKTKNYSAVYFVDMDGYRHLFVTRPIYDTWFKSWKTKPIIEVIPSEEFDGLKAGPNAAAKPGSLIRFESSLTVYEVLPDNSLCQIADAAAGSSLFGKNWQSKIVNSPLSDSMVYKTGDCVLTATSALPAIKPVELINAP